MQTLIAKFIFMFAALTLLIPESYAKRMGSGRSAGRQTQTMRQRAAPVPPMQRQQPAPQPMPSQPAPPVASPRPVPAPAVPTAPVRRQANSGFGGFFTGALIGLGLGSLISSNNANQNQANQSSGAGGDWTDAPGNNTQQSSATQQEQQPQGNPFGALILLAIVALLVRYLVRRSRTRRLANTHTRNRF